MQTLSSQRLKTAPSNPSKGPFRKTSCNKEPLLRQNYILSTKQCQSHLPKEIQHLINSPKFNRFISLKKGVFSSTEKFAGRLNVQETPKKKPLESTFNRRQLFFMRQRRPEHNSPIKLRVQEGRSKDVQDQENKEPILIEEENTMLIKQVVTHFEQPKRTIKPIENPYSPRSEKRYYVAEILKHYKNMDSLVFQHIFNSMFFLQLLANYSLPQNQPQCRPLNLAQKEQYKGKPTIVFDLDETLVHCFEELSEPHEVELPIYFRGGGSMIAPLNIRPGAKELLASLAEEFQIMIFTASHQSYANEVINYLDPRGQYVQHRLYRHNCVYVQEGYYVKDLRLLGRDLSKVVLVDNAAYSYAFQVANGIPIVPYYEGKNDYQMKALGQYLRSLHGDVRERNKEAFRLHEYLNFQEVQDLVQHLYS